MNWKEKAVHTVIYVKAAFNRGYSYMAPPMVVVGLAMQMAIFLKVFGIFSKWAVIWSGLAFTMFCVGLGVIDMKKGWNEREQEYAYSRLIRKGEN